MTDKRKPVGKMSGITSFADDDDDYIAPPTREVRATAKAGGASLGFVSDKPPAAEGVVVEPPVAPASVAPPERKKRTRLPSQYPDHYNLRLRDGDRERFDEYAYQHRMAKGDVFALMLDLLEAQDRDKAPKRR